MIKLDNYRIFSEVAKTRSFSKSTETLFMTQSAVSQNIKQLETELNTTLFTRTTKGVTLTNEGEILYRYISDALELIEIGEISISKINNLEYGNLKIAASDTIVKHILLKHLKYFNTIYPNIKLTIINRTTSECIDLLKNGTVDISFINLPYCDNQIITEEIKTIKDVFIAGSKYDYLKNKVISFSDILSLPIILLEKKSNSRRVIDVFFKDNGHIIIPEIELGSYNLLVDFTKSNIGISCVTLDFCKKSIDDKSIFVINTDFHLPERSIGVCRLKGKPLSMASLKFINIVKSRLSL